MKKLFYSCILLLLFTASSFADKITQYDIDIEIESSGGLSIVERIAYDFEGESKHGIFRDIPFTIKVGTRIIDLGLDSYAVKMNGQDIAWKQSIIRSSSMGEMVHLKIGDPASYVTDIQHYEIRYHVNIGLLLSAQDSLKDAIRWNIIGTAWTIPIENITARFMLPTLLSPASMTTATYTGLYGSTTSDAQNYWTDKGDFIVKIASLKAHEGATVELAYPRNTLGQDGSLNVEERPIDRFFAYWHWGHTFLHNSKFHAHHIPDLLFKGKKSLNIVDL
ncbi:MAG: DUF2207 domain-containing protein [Sulfurovum sp.]|nr:DUF2207 domain-containing protein [Sulfurovum sp.]